MSKKENMHMGKPRQNVGSWLWLLIAVCVFLLSVQKLDGHTRKFPDPDIQVVLPRFMQVVLAGGDRYLAANIAVVRSLLNSFGGDNRERYGAQALVQRDAAWLNPRHEDNYYVAAALLSWSDHVGDAESILYAAAQARPFDMLPPLYLGFDYFYFDRNATLGAQWMYEAARRADSEQNRISLTRIASRWAERGQDARDALRMVEVMIQQARGVALKQYLQLRAQRLLGLVQLQEAARRYQGRTGKQLSSLDELVRSGELHRLPIDPQGHGYTLDENGVPILIQDPIRGPGRNH